MSVSWFLWGDSASWSPSSFLAYLPTQTPEHNTANISVMYLYWNCCQRHFSIRSPDSLVWFCKHFSELRVTQDWIIIIILQVLLFSLVRIQWNKASLQLNGSFLLPNVMSGSWLKQGLQPVKQRLCLPFFCVRYTNFHTFLKTCTHS